MELLCNIWKFKGQYDDHPNQRKIILLFNFYNY